MILSVKYELMRKNFRNFAETEFTTEIQEKLDKEGGFDTEMYKKMAKYGFPGIKIPVKYGGQGGDSLAYVLMNEEFARICPVLAIYANTSNSLGGGPLLACGNEEQLQKYLVPVAKGEKHICFALTEPGAGSDAGSMTTRAVEDGDYYVLNGRKTFITMAPLADWAVVYAKTDMSMGTKGISAFIVDMKQEGVSCGKPEKKMGGVGCATSDIILENVRVHKDNLLGQEGKGFINAMKTLDTGRMGVAAQSIGVAQGCLDEAIKYAKERKQFGRPIAKFQAIAFMLAEMATKLEAAKNLVYKTAWLIDNGQDASMAASMAKFYASEVCNEIAAKTVQIHGGYGFIKDYKIERMFRDCRVFTIYEGTSQVQQMVISGKLLK